MASDANSEIGRSPAPLDELEIKQEELRVRRVEADAALAAARSRRSRLSDPLVLAIIAAVISLLGSIAVAIYNNKSTLDQEKIKAEHGLDLEQKKASYSLVLQAMATNDTATAKRNIQFFIDAGLLQDSDCRISEAAERYDPVLPSVSGTTPALPGVYSPLDIARLYNFPTWLDGRGQTIGILEFGGSIGRTDLASYFGTLNLPVPDVTAVSIDSGREQPDPMVDGEVMSNIEIAGAIAPKARIRVYFAADSEGGWEDAINRAGDDHVSIFFIGWGGPESRWTDKHINEVNMALRQLAQRGVTILVAAGDNGVTDGVDDQHRHVDFPASSPWVLAIGGTNLQAADKRIVSETGGCVGVG
jgi:subtilase family serine protease